MKKGIDVSYYDGDINWSEIEKTDVSFVFVRCGYCNSDGSIELDKKFKTYMKALKKTRLKVGIYIYSYAESKKAAKRAAREMLRLIKPYRVSYPVVFDIEDKKYEKERKKKNTALVKAFLEETEKHNYYSMFYTNKYFLEEYLDRNALSDYDLWIARYNRVVGYKGEYGIWQYTDKGKIKGISGHVDMDIAYKDYAKIIKKNKLNHL